MSAETIPTTQPEDKAGILQKAGKAAEFSLGVIDDPALRESTTSLGRNMLTGSGVFKEGDPDPDGGPANLELSKWGLIKASANLPLAAVKGGAEAVKGAPKVIGNLGRAALTSVVEVSGVRDQAPAVTYGASEMSNSTGGFAPEQVDFAVGQNPAETAPLDVDSLYDSPTSRPPEQPLEQPVQTAEAPR